MAEKPYYEPHYLELIKQAREKHLGNIQATSAAIIRLYREAAADLAERAAASRKGSLSQRWADEYAKSLAKRADELEAGLYDVTLQGLKRSAELPAAAMGQWWEAVGGQSFRDAFALPQDNVLAGIIEGGFYKDNQGLSRRIWRLADSFEKDIGYIVQRGIAEKKAALELARDLEQYVKPPAAREWDWGKVYPNLSGKKVDYNAQRLARTAINHAYFLDNVRVCTENPFVTAMHWDLSNAHDERQVIPFGPDECDDYAEHDEGLGMGNFKPDELPCPHPQCLCAQWAVIPESLEDIGRQIGAWASGEPDERLDEWYDKYGSQNPNGDPREIILRGNSGAAQTGENRESPLQNNGGRGIINLPDIQIFRSVGAKARNYNIVDPRTGEIFHLVEGSKIKNVQVFAGKGTRSPLHDGVAEGLTEQYGGSVSEWQHAKGHGVIDCDGDEVGAEIHWFQEPSVGRVKFKVKEWDE